MRRKVGVAAGALALAVVGLAGTASASPSGSDRDIAKRAVLTIDDVPSGYRQGSIPGSISPPNNRACRTYLPEYRRARGQAEGRSHNFEQGSGMVVANLVTVWSDEAGATNYMRVISNESLPACLKLVIGDGIKSGLKKRNTSYDKLDVEVGRESSSPIGDEQASFQAKVTVDQGSMSPSFFIDYQIVRVNRGITIFQLTSSFTPFDQSERANIVSNGVSRLANALAVPVSASLATAT